MGGDCAERGDADLLGDVVVVFLLVEGFGAWERGGEGGEQAGNGFWEADVLVGAFHDAEHISIGEIWSVIAEKGH